MEPVLPLPEDGGRWIEPFLKAQARRCVREPQEPGAVCELHEVNLDFGVHHRASVKVKHFQHPIQTDNLSHVPLVPIRISYLIPIFRRGSVQVQFSEEAQSRY